MTEVRTEDGIAQFEYGVGNSLRKKKNGDEIVSYSEVQRTLMLIVWMIELRLRVME